MIRFLSRSIDLSITFKEIKCDKAISLITGFDVGEDLYYIERVRYLGKQAVIYDTNIFLISEAKGLTEDIARDSIYRYPEDTLGMTITTSRRRVTAELATERDHELLDLGHFDFVLTVVGQVFNSFAETAVRQKV